MKKTLTFRDGVALVLGSIVGSGIFASPGVVFRHVHSGGASLCVWALSGTVAYSGAMCYVELGTALPSSGAEVEYLKRAFGPMVSFLFTWANAIVARPASFAITSLVFAQYACRVVNWEYGDSCAISGDAVRALAVACTAAVTVINLVSARATSTTMAWTTSTSVVALVIAMMAGLYYALTVSTAEFHTRLGFADTSKNVLDYAPAFLSALWAFDGWNTLNYASEEMATVDDLLRVVQFSMPLVTFLFVFVNASYLIVLPPDVVQSSETLGVNLASATFGKFGEHVVPFFVAVSAFGSAVGNLYGGSRLVYSGARDGPLPSAFATLTEKSSVPINAILCQFVLGLMYLTSGNFEQLIGVFSCAVWAFYFLTVVGLLRLRFLEPDLPRPFRVNMMHPMLFLSSSLALVLIEFAANPINSGVALMLIMCGVPYYYFQHSNLAMNMSKTRFGKRCGFCLRRAAIEAAALAEQEELEEEEITVNYNTF